MTWRREFHQCIHRENTSVMPRSIEYREGHATGCLNANVDALNRNGTFGFLEDGDAVSS